MLDVCPQCAYSLQGLPPDHACPECGMRYDHDSEVYRHLSPKVLYTGMLGLIAGTLGMFNLPRTFGISEPFWRLCIRLFLLIYFGGALWLARCIYLLYRSGPLVAILPDGLYVRLRRIRGEWIPWTRVTRAVLNQKHWGATIVLNDRRPDLNIVGVFATPDDSRRFVSQVAARVETAKRVRE